MKRAAYVLGFFLLLTAGGIVALNRGISLGFAHNLIETRLSAQLQREVRLTRPLHVRVGNAIELRVEGLSLANADWATSEPLLSIGTAELAVDTRSLFSDTLVVSALSISGLDFVLDHDGEGQNSLPALASDTDESDDEDQRRIVVLHAELSKLHAKSLNRPNGADIDFRVQRLSQQSRATGLLLEGNGTLQERPWTLHGNGSDLDSILRGRNLHGQLQATLDQLTLEAHYDLPDVHRLADLSLDATLTGPLPPRVAALSPVLDAGETMRLDLLVTDVDPGINLLADIQLQQLEVKLTGTIDHPGSGDGIELSLDLDAASLPRLAQALNLGSTEEVPLRVDASLTRRGAQFHLSDIVAEAGDHRITGDVRIPTFPTVDDAQISVHVAGDDFSFVQELLETPATISDAYTASLTVQELAGGREQVEATLRIGDVVADLSGQLGDHPHYAGSTLQWAFSGPDAGAVTALAGVALPPVSFNGEGRAKVDDAGFMSIESLQLSFPEMSLQAEGRLRVPPDLNELDLTLRWQTDSLARSSHYLGLDPLGDLPGRISLRATGSPYSLELGDLEASFGGLELSQTDGSLILANGDLKSDLQLEVTASDIPQLLGSYAVENQDPGSLSFVLAPLIDSRQVSVQIKDLQGDGVSGNALLRLPPDLSLGADAQLEADVTIENPAQFLPATDFYVPPQHPLHVRASTRGESAQKIQLSIADAQSALLRGELQLPRQSNSTLLTITGEGSDVKRLGHSPLLPSGDLPYEVRLNGALEKGSMQLEIETLTVGASQLNGDIRLTDPNQVYARLHIPRAEVPRWISAWKSQQKDAVSAEAHAQNNFLIPDTPLPLTLLDGWQTDIEIITGDLGLPDPRFTEAPLVREAQLSLKGSGSNQRLHIQRLSGGRGRLALDANISVPDSEAMIDVELSVEDLALGLTSQGTSLETLPRHRIDSKLTMQGTSYRELAASLNGELLLTGGPGTVSNVGYSFATESFLAQFFGALLPGLETTSTDMKVSCTLLAMRAQDGLVRLDPGFVFRTGRVDMSARGVIDLRDETLAIRFDNQARKGLGFSAASLVNPYVQIAGTLSKPTLGLDIKHSALAGGAAVATGGLTVIAKPLIGRFLLRGDPCEKALKRWKTANEPSQ